MPDAVACMAAHELNTFGKISQYGTRGHYKTHSAEKVMCIAHACKEVSRSAQGTIVQEVSSANYQAGN